MKINRKMGLTAFQQYVSPYDINDEKIRVKVEHTYRVAGICDQIARSLPLSEEDVDLAWLIGLLHDIGRFEQVRIYNTFIDTDSVDHAEYGADILFPPKKIEQLNKEDVLQYGEGDVSHENTTSIRTFVENGSEDKTIEAAIRNHNRFMIQEGLTERERVFSNILRDADKVDILKVNVEGSISEIYNLPMERFEQDEVTPEVLENFMEGKTILKSLKKTAIDHMVGHISLTYGLVYLKSLEITEKQGYLDQLLHFPTKNPVTRKQFQQMQAQMNTYLNQRKVQA
ncbi:MAG: HD domain-containing protein [Lachnospiraceae bacterium]|nr:HD domain-containing protein [Lachnospiraceae bacterium]